MKVGEKSSSAMRLQVALDQRLALGVRGLRVDRRGLVDLAVGDAVDAAGRHVDEARDAGLLGQLWPGGPNPGG